MNVTFPDDTIYVNFNFPATVLEKQHPKKFKFSSDDVLVRVKEIADKVQAEYEKLNLDEETVGAVVFSFDPEKTTLFSSKSVYVEDSVEKAALRFVSMELLPTINANNFEKGLPLIILPPLGSETNLFTQLGLSLESTLDHIEVFQNISEKNEGSWVPPVSEYVRKYGIPPYTVLAVWGLTLRSLLRDRVVKTEDETLPLFVDYVANMVTPGVWGDHNGQVSITDKNLDVSAAFAKFHAKTQEAFRAEEEEAAETPQNPLLVPNL